MKYQSRILFQKHITDAFHEPPVQFPITQTPITFPWKIVLDLVDNVEIYRHIIPTGDGLFDPIQPFHQKDLQTLLKTSTSDTIKRPDWPIVLNPLGSVRSGGSGSGKFRLLVPRRILDTTDSDGQQEQEERSDGSLHRHVFGNICDF